jgi:U3 small nucleolar RNA-associated protein 6
MEKVHFQLESTLPELKDLQEKGLFTKQELRQITLHRTKHESALIKRAGKPEDFLKYAEYEIGIERLRKIRWKRLSRFPIGNSKQF